MSQTLGFLLFVSLVAVLRGAVSGDDDLSLKSTALAGMDPEAPVPRKAPISRKEWGWERGRTSLAQTSTKQSLA